MIQIRNRGVVNANLVPYYENFTDVLRALDARFTATRASSQWVFNSAGVLTELATDVIPAHATQPYDPVTLEGQGVMVEGQAVNQIRNPRCEGASAPSTLPTNWLVAPAAGISFSVEGVGVESGIEYIDIRFTGTATGASQIIFESSTAVAAAASQVWTGSAFLVRSAGTATNVSSILLNLREGTAAGGFVANNITTITVSTGNLSENRKVAPNAMMDATAERVTLVLIVNTAGAVDITLRIGLPQLVQAPFATTPILPPVGAPAASTRARTIVQIDDLSTIDFNPDEGSVFVEFVCPPLGTAGLQSVLTFSDGTGNNRIQIRISDSASDNAQFVVVQSGAVQALITGPVLVTGQTVRVAASWAENEFRFSVNGATYTADLSGTVPTVDRFAIGWNSYSAGEELNSTIKDCLYRRRASTQAELSAWTGA